MGLDLTVFRAVNRADILFGEEIYDHPFAPALPADKAWVQAAYWRKHYGVWEALTDGRHGDHPVTLDTLDRLDAAIGEPGWVSSHLCSDDSVRETAAQLRGYLTAGDALYVEAIS